MIQDDFIISEVLTSFMNASAQFILFGKPVIDAWIVFFRDSI